MISVTAFNKLFRVGIIASKHINCLVAWAGISAAQRLIATDARSEFKGSRLSFVDRAYCVFLSATEPQNLNEIGLRDRTHSHSTNVRNKLLSLFHNKYSSFLDEIQVGTQALFESAKSVSRSTENCCRFAESGGKKCDRPKRFLRIMQQLSYDCADNN